MLSLHLNYIKNQDDDKDTKCKTTKHVNEKEYMHKCSIFEMHILAEHMKKP